MPYHKVAVGAIPHYLLRTDPSPAHQSRPSFLPRIQISDAACEPIPGCRALTSHALETTPVARPAKANWSKVIAKYQQPRVSRAVLQLASTFVPLAGLF